MCNYYKYKNKYLFSTYEYSMFKKVSLDEFIANKNKYYYLKKSDPLYSRRSFSVSHPDFILSEREDIDIILDIKEEKEYSLPEWLIKDIYNGNIISINTNYPHWSELLEEKSHNKWKVNILALGDVGSTLLIGLKLLGGELIEKIGICDRNENNKIRWEYEMNQVRKAFSNEKFPMVKGIDIESLFDCDMFVFCASKGVPPTNSKAGDVRMVQFNGNSAIIKEYAYMARKKHFKGIFAVISDPVDLLCKKAFLESNKDEYGNLDFEGIPADKVIGYGLGVMNGRAAFYAEMDEKTKHFLNEGRVFGPHGEGLIVADSIKNYNESLSNLLTEKTKNSNLKIRSLGYKPYIAPSLSSGALSLLSTMSGDWFYGSTYMGGAYIGAKCRLIDNNIEVEKLNLPEPLFSKIKAAYERLVKII